MRFHLLTGLDRWGICYYDYVCEESVVGFGICGMVFRSWVTICTLVTMKKVFEGAGECFTVCQGSTPIGWSSSWL